MAYDVRISYWRSDVCSSVLSRLSPGVHGGLRGAGAARDARWRQGRRFPYPRTAPAYEQGRYRDRGGAAWNGCRDELVLLRPDARGAALRPVRQLPPAPPGFCRCRAGRPDPLRLTLTYSVNTIFLTLQGEGSQARSAAP